MHKFWKVFAAMVTIIVLASAGAISAFSKSPSDSTAVTVYKSPTCGCCTKWVDYLKENGFQIALHDLSQSELSQIKTKYGVHDTLTSCHTAIVDGYVVEGHVPVDVIQRLLKEKPDVIGITVPGMPMGSPGMEGSYSEPYDILTFDRDGKTQVYTSR